LDIEELEAERAELRAERAPWLRADRAGAVMALQSLTLSEYEWIGKGYQSHIHERYIEANLTRARIPFNTNIIRNLLSRGESEEDWNTLVHDILLPWIKIYRAAKTIQQAFFTNASKKRIQRRNAIIFKELMEVVWHPNRIIKNMEIID